MAIHQPTRKALVTVLLCGALLLPSVVAGSEEQSSAALPDPLLILDLNPGRIPDPLDPMLLTPLGNRLFFTGANEETGREPWVSDGTDAGTRLLADLCPGPCSSSVFGFAEIGGKLMMLAQSVGPPQLLVEENGQLEPAFDLAGSTASFFQLGDLVYFPLNEAPRPDLIYGRTRLMQSDGTAAGTVAISTLCSGPVCGAGLSYRKLNGGVFFLSSNASVGTDLNLLVPGQPIRTILSYGQFTSISLPLGALDSQRVVFAVSGVFQAGTTPWVFTFGGDAAPINASSNTNDADKQGYFVFWRGRLYYRNTVGQAVTTDGTPGDLRPATELTGPSPGVLAGTASQLFYTTGDTLRVLRANGNDQALITGEVTYRLGGVWGEKVLINTGYGLWASDGTPAGTVELPAPADFGSSSGFGGVPFGSVLVYPAGPNEGFGGATPTDKFDLWRTDGSAGGTYEIAGDSTGPASSGARPYALGSKLIVDTTSAGVDRKLWRVDPETWAAEVLSSSALVPLANNGRVLLAQDPASRQVYAVRDSGPPLALPVTDIVMSQSARVVVAPDGRFFFTDYSDGQELWASDGTVAGTRELFDLDPTWTEPCGPTEECYLELPGAITPVGNQVFFVGHAPGAPHFSNSLWVYDRATGQKRPVSLPPTDFDFQPFSHFLAVGSHLVFKSTDLNPAHRELWRTDGTISEPFFETDELVDSEIAIGDRFFFRLAAGQLWVSDMTPEGTFQLLSLSTSITNLIRVGDHVFYNFQALTGEMQLGWSDGTPAGTSSMPFAGLPLYQNLDELLATGDHRLVFAARVGTGGKALFIGDGTPAGTRRLGDAGGPEPNPVYFAQIGNRLFFQGEDVHSGRELWAIDLPAASPGCPADKLCLDEGRFEVSVEVRTPDGVVRQGRRALATSESGVFTFFVPDNWEFLVKVLDGCGLNDHFWVYAAAATDVAYTLTVHDRATGATRTYANPAGQAARPILDSAAFAGCAAEAPAPLYTPVAAPAEVARRCVDDLSELCLDGGRFRVEAEWRTATGSGKAHAVANGSADSGLFSFFSPSNWELMVKVLDGCALNGKHWVFAAGTTDVGWTLRVEDLATGEVKVYRNALGNPSIAVTDTSALGGCGS